MPYTIRREATTVVTVGSQTGPQINRANKVVEEVAADSIAHATDKSGVNALGPAYTGELTTRTNNTDGTITLDPGHSVATGRVDLYWSTGKRRGVTGTVTGDSLAITGGSGDNLPAQDSDIVAMNPEVETATFLGDDLDSLVAAGDRNVVFQVVLTESNNTELLVITLSGNDNAYEWLRGTGVTNPLAGDSVGKIYISQDAITPAEIQVLALKS